MNKLIFSFIIFGILLFVGIAIMMKPTAFVSVSVPSEPSSEQMNKDMAFPRAIIILASALTITGLVGLSIQGFRMFKVFGQDKTSPD